MCGLQGIKQTTVKDAYPLPLVYEVQDRLSGCTIFSIHWTYSQVIGNFQYDYEKTSFCPGPGLGLFQFR